MNEQSFWAVIDASRAQAAGDPGTHIGTLQAALQELDADEIVDFDSRFRACLARAYSWDLWGAAYVIGGGCSDDGFTDFRAWLVSKGKAVYEAALRDPDSLAECIGEEDGDAQFEEFTYAASKAWEEKLGKSPDEFPWQGSEQAPEPSGEPWEEDEEELARRYPKLSARFGD